MCTGIGDGGAADEGGALEDAGGGWAVGAGNGAEEVEGVDAFYGGTALAAESDQGGEFDGEEGWVVAQAEEAGSAA